MTDTTNIYSDVVAQASGMVSVQADCNVTEAVVIMRDMATDTDCTVEEIADLVVSRDIQFRD
jgi:AmiR/NasT family two-component response regulator